MSIHEREQKVLSTFLNHHFSNTTPSPTHLHQYQTMDHVIARIHVSLYLICFLLGMMAAPLAFQTGNDQKLNIFWLLVILLGAHGFNLLFWLATLLFFKNGHVLSTVQTLLIHQVGRFLKWDDGVMNAFIQLRLEGIKGFWFRSRFTHAAWTAYLLGGVLSALFFLMTHQVQFVWQTTLLTQQNFADLTHFISILPSIFGIATPTLADIEWAQFNHASQPDETRQRWAIWLLGCVMVYGVVMRVALWAGSRWRYRQTFHQSLLKLSANTKAFSQERTILDADHVLLEANKHPSYQRDEQSNVRLEVVNQIDSAKHYFLFEWSGPLPKQINAMTQHTFLDDGSTQQAFLQQPIPEQGGSQNILVIASASSPDRGSLRFMKHAVAHCEAIWLFSGEFTEDWVNALLALGITPSKVAELKD